MPNQAIKQAIQRSISHDECVYLRESEPIVNELLAECDDFAETGTFWDFWGTDERDDGSSREWRIMVRKTVQEAK